MSYKASQLIANAKKPFTIGEDLVLPVAIRMTEIIHGQKYADELKTNPLSNDTVGRQILEISNDQCEQLIERIKESSKFAIQLDESTDFWHMSGIVMITVYMKILYFVGPYLDVQLEKQFF